MTYSFKTNEVKVFTLSRVLNLSSKFVVQPKHFFGPSEGTFTEVVKDWQ